MMTKFSPCDIEVLLHCYYSPELHPRDDTPAVQASYGNLMLCGLIEPQCFMAGVDTTNLNGYRTTGRGRAHVMQLCTLPIPSFAWVDGNGKIIELN
jgi:hypothetical protein